MNMPNYVDFPNTVILSP